MITTILEWTTFRLEGNQYLLDCARGIRKYSEPTGMQAAQFLYDLGANGYLHENFAAADLAEAPGQRRTTQQRIAKATLDKDWRRVKALQRSLNHSFSARALAAAR